MNNILFMIFIAFLTTTCQLSANIGGDPETRFIESIKLHPNWKLGTTDLVLGVSRGTLFEIRNISWEDLAILSLNEGDQVEVLHEELDFSNHGDSLYEIFFDSSEKKMVAVGLSSTSLPLEPLGFPKHIFNFTKEENGYSFITDGGVHWIIDNEEQFTLQNGDAVFMENEKILPYIIGASQYDVISSSGEKLGHAISDSTFWKPLDEWESQDCARIFTVIDMDSNYSNYSNTLVYTNMHLQNALTGEVFYINTYTRSNFNGDRIALIDYKIVTSICGESDSCMKGMAVLYNIDKKSWFEELGIMNIMRL